jgi:hypothetical protein
LFKLKPSSLIFLAFQEKVLNPPLTFFILELIGGEKLIKSSIAFSYFGVPFSLLFSLYIVIYASLIAARAAP